MLKICVSHFKNTGPALQGLKADTPTDLWHKVPFYLFQTIGHLLWYAYIYCINMSMIVYVM